MSMGRKVQTMNKHLLAHETGVTGSPESVFPRKMIDYYGCDGTIPLNA